MTMSTRQRHPPLVLPRKVRSVSPNNAADRATTDKIRWPVNLSSPARRKPRRNRRALMDEASTNTNANPATTDEILWPANLSHPRRSRRLLMDEASASTTTTTTNSAHLPTDQLGFDAAKIMKTSLGQRAAASVKARRNRTKPQPPRQTPSSSGLTDEKKGFVDFNCKKPTQQLEQPRKPPRRQRLQERAKAPAYARRATVSRATNGTEVRNPTLSTAAAALQQDRPPQQAPEESLASEATSQSWSSSDFTSSTVSTLSSGSDRRLWTSGDDTGSEAAEALLPLPSAPSHVDDGDSMTENEDDFTVDNASPSDDDTSATSSKTESKSGDICGRRNSYMGLDEILSTTSLPFSKDVTQDRTEICVGDRRAAAEASPVGDEGAPPTPGQFRRAVVVKKVPLKSAAPQHEDSPAVYVGGRVGNEGVLPSSRKFRSAVMVKKSPQKTGASRHQIHLTGAQLLTNNLKRDTVVFDSTSATSSLTFDTNGKNRDVKRSEENKQMREEINKQRDKEEVVSPGKALGPTEPADGALKTGDLAQEHEDKQVNQEWLRWVPSMVRLYRYKVTRERLWGGEDFVDRYAMMDGMAGTRLEAASMSSRGTKNRWGGSSASSDCVGSVESSERRIAAESPEATQCLMSEITEECVDDFSIDNPSDFLVSPSPVSCDWKAESMEEQHLRKTTSPRSIMDISLFDRTDREGNSVSLSERSPDIHNKPLHRSHKSTRIGIDSSQQESASKLERKPLHAAGNGIGRQMECFDERKSDHQYHSSFSTCSSTDSSEAYPAEEDLSTYVLAGAKELSLSYQTVLTSKGILSPVDLVSAAVTASMQEERVGKSALYRRGITPHLQISGKIGKQLHGRAAVVDEVRRVYETAARHLQNEHYDEAMEQYEELLCNCEAGSFEVGDERLKNQLMGLCMHNIAVIHMRAGMYDHTAELWLEAVLTLRDATATDALHQHVAIALNEMGITQFACGRFEKALTAFTDALELWQALRGCTDESVAKTINNIGMVHLALHSPHEALEAFEEALEIYRPVLTGRLPTEDDESRPRELLGASAPKLCRRSVLIRGGCCADTVRVLLSVAKTLCNMGHVYVYLGQPHFSKVVLEEVVLIQQAVLGDRDGHTIASMDLLSVVNSMRTSNEKKPTSTP